MLAPGEQRDALQACIRLHWLETGNITHTAQALGVCRATVRAVVEESPGLREARAEREEQAAAERSQQLAEQRAEAAGRARAWSQAHLGEPLSDGAAELAVSTGELRRLLGPRASLHPRRIPGHRNRYTDAEILQTLRDWADEAPDTNGLRYQSEAAGRGDWPSLSAVLLRFDSWHAALLAAGITPTNRPQPHPRRWSTETLEALVRDYFAQHDSWSLEGLGRWLEADPHRPSLSRVRTRLGPWPVLCRLADEAGTRIPTRRRRR